MKTPFPPAWENCLRRENSLGTFMQFGRAIIATLTPTTGQCPGPHRFSKDEMKRTKRLSIEFWHREVTITVEGSGLHVAKNEPLSDNTAAVCPTCGSLWIAIVARADGDVPADTERIHRALQQSGLHLQVSPTGQLKICQKSFEEVKETF